jgi:hypothetical protein
MYSTHTDNLYMNSVWSMSGVRALEPARLGGGAMWARTRLRGGEIVGSSQWFEALLFVFHTHAA